MRSQCSAGCLVLCQHSCSGCGFALDPLGQHMRHRDPSAPNQAISGSQRVLREQRLSCDCRAMSGIHYKFSSKLSYDMVTFHGHSISLGDLKRQIMAREKLKVANCDLQILKAETSEGEWGLGPGPPRGSTTDHAVPQAVGATLCPRDKSQGEKAQWCI